MHRLAAVDGAVALLVARHVVLQRRQHALGLFGRGNDAAADHAAGLMRQNVDEVEDELSLCMRDEGQVGVGAVLDLGRDLDLDLRLFAAGRFGFV